MGHGPEGSYPLPSWTRAPWSTLACALAPSSPHQPTQVLPLTESLLVMPMPTSRIM